MKEEEEEEDDDDDSLLHNYSEGRKVNKVFQGDYGLNNG